MKLHKLCISILLLLSSGLLHAQQFGLTAGYSMTNFNQSNTVAGVTTDGETAFLNGAHFGPSYNHRFSPKYNLNAELLLEMRSGRYDISWYKPATTNTRELYYLVVPIQLEYKIALKENNSIFFCAGPQVNIGLLGRTNEHYYLATKPQIKNNDVFRDSTMNNVDLGFSIGAGVAFGDFRVKTDYAFGLNNSIKNSEPSEIYQNVWRVSFQYYFKQKEKEKK